MPNLNLYKNRSQYRMVRSNETGQTDFAVSYNTRTKAFLGKGWETERVSEACYKIKKQYMCMWGHVRNADQTVVYFDMLSNITLEEKDTNDFDQRHGQREN